MTWLTFAYLCGGQLIFPVSGFVIASFYGGWPFARREARKLRLIFLLSPIACVISVSVPVVGHHVYAFFLLAGGVFGALLMDRGRDAARVREN